MKPQARAIAFYLPQFHPVPENSKWWGPGFTEWTNVAQARPLFRGHKQPHIPGELGFYDLRVGETRQKQADLAQEHGIEVFCYWHYWFGNGRRLLERPFQEVLEWGTPTMPFCLGWANESWTGSWYGAKDRVLIEQSYPGTDDHRAHFAALESAFRDCRYFCVDGRPVFHIHRPGGFESAAAFVEQWQAMAVRAGLPGLYLVAELDQHYATFIEDGFDAGIRPQLPYAIPAGHDVVTRFRRKVLGHPLVRSYSDTPLPARPLHNECVQPVVFPNWDNTPRSGSSGIVLTGSTPERFRKHVRAAVDALRIRPQQERLLWIKSWNEWAEGNYLEPDTDYGRARLEVFRDEIFRGSDNDSP